MEKRLCKSNDRKLCGVCAGVAEYFDIDPSIVRVALVVISLFWGVGVIAYIAAALILPDKKIDAIDVEKTEKTE